MIPRRERPHTGSKSHGKAETCRGFFCAAARKSALFAAARGTVFQLMLFIFRHNLRRI